MDTPKTAGCHSHRFLLPYTFASIPSGPQYSLTCLPQCGHLISSTVHSKSMSSLSKVRRPHSGFGHRIFSTDIRLPALICNKGTRQAGFSPCLVPFYLLFFIGFLPWSLCKSGYFTYLKIPRTSSIPCSPSNLRNCTLTA